MKPAAVIVVLALAAVAAWSLLRDPGSPEPGSPEAPASAPSAALTEPEMPVEAIEAGKVLAKGPKPLPRGLRGTTPSGGLTVDASGHFVPDRDALIFFEYFFSASNEESQEEILARIEAAISERLSPPAEGEAHAFLHRFQAFREAAQEEFTAPGLAGSAAMERRLQWVRELRREHFGAEVAERLFGEDEDALRVYLERKRVIEDPALDEETRRAQLEALEASFPERVRDVRARASSVLRHSAEVEALREAGASESEIDALREEQLGPEAAARLRELDASRARFAERVAAYRAERDATLAEIDDPAERARVHAELRAAHFEAEEVRRVEMLERTEGTGSPH